ncbi:MAG: efflux RND transporter periplasmic adaptor subunit [Gammaproteobacteria bacterium]|nr:efflux RND transporter periplasmic adaptor subunit [Gammaproteobacteria bacterium]
MNSRVIAIATLLWALVGCEAPSEVAIEEEVRPAKIITVDDASVTNMRHFPALVEANQGANLAFRVSGELQSFPVKPGDRVAKGQLLAALDDEDFKLALNDRAARFELAKTQFERAQTLLDKKLAPQSQLDEAAANLKITEAEFERAKSDLEHTELRAPYSGSIAKVYVKNRENIQAKQNILRILSRDVMDVTIQVPERIMALVKRGVNYQPQVTFDFAPEQSYPVTIKEWDTQADPATLSYRVVFSLPTPEAINVLPGMSATVHIDLNAIVQNATDHILLPVEAVFVPDNETVDAGEAFVWRYHAEQQGVELVKVIVGDVQNKGIEIISGVSPGDQIVAAGVHQLRADMKVKPWHKERGL